jgi:hypothetical protein
MYFIVSLQNFFNNLCLSAKAGKAVELAKEALADNKAVVFGFMHTGKAALNGLLSSQVKVLEKGHLE